MSTLLELVRFFKARKKLILLPLVIFMVLIAMILVAAQGSILAPFIYTLF